MRLQVKLTGIPLARARLAEVGRKIEPVVRGALNMTASKVRAELYVNPMMGSIGKRAWLNARIKIKRANSRRMNARLIPSSSGISITQMKTWGFDPIGPTRARIWVRGPGGKKVAAGFVNPSGRGKMPLSTRSERARNVNGKRARLSPDIQSYRYDFKPVEAMAPSVAYWFKTLSGRETILWINTYLQQEFEMRLRKEIAKGAR